MMATAKHTSNSRASWGRNFQGDQFDSQRKNLLIECLWAPVQPFRPVVVFGGGWLCFRGADVIAGGMCRDVMWYDVMRLVARWDAVMRLYVRWREVRECGWLGDVMSCYVMCCHVVRCDVVWCGIMSSRAMWCDVNGMWCHVSSCDVLSCDVMWCHVKWCDAMGRDGLGWDGLLCGCDTVHVAGCEIMSCDAMWLCYVVNEKMLWNTEGPCNTTTTPYYKVLRGTTKNYCVLQSTTTYYQELLRTSKHYNVLPGITQH